MGAMGRRSKYSAEVRERAARLVFEQASEHRSVYGVEPICEVLPIAPSTYRLHAARRRAPEKRPARAKRDEWLRVEIQRVWDEAFDGVYGAEKVWRQLGREDVEVARCTV